MKDLNPPDYDFVWTVDGEDWNGELFDSLDELRDFAGDLVSANEGNPAFKFYGRRFEVMDACDMLDRGIRPERVRLARFEEGGRGRPRRRGVRPGKAGASRPHRGLRDRLGAADRTDARRRGRGPRAHRARKGLEV